MRTLISTLALALMISGAQAEVVVWNPIRFFAKPAPGEMLVSRFRLSRVLTSSGENVGRLQDVVLSADGREAKIFIVGVGGFLGLGTTYVGLLPEEFEIITDSKGETMLKLKRPLTKEILQTAPEFELLNSR